MEIELMGSFFTVVGWGLIGSSLSMMAYRWKAAREYAEEAETERREEAEHGGAVHRY